METVNIEKSKLNEPNRATILKIISLVSLTVMSVLLPLWLILGNNGGWGTFRYIFIVGPTIFVSFWVLASLLAMRPSSRVGVILGIFDIVLLLALYLSIFLHGFFFVDGGDTEKSYSSVATAHYGMNIVTSTKYAHELYAVSFFLLIASFIYFTVALIVSIILKSANKRSQTEETSSAPSNHIADANNSANPAS